MYHRAVSLAAKTKTTVQGRSRILAIAATGLASLFAACSLPRDETIGSADAAPLAPTIDATLSSSGSSSGGGSSGGSSSGGSSSGGSSSGVVIPITSACRAGFYQGLITGSYFSDVDSGAPLSLTGNVKFTLAQQGTAEQLCTITVIGLGMTTEGCNQIFTIAGGTIVGMMTNPGDGAVGGLAYSCTVSGTLDCEKKILVDGWIQCSYCDGPALDDAGSCAATAAGGRFAGPLTVNYDTSTLAFVDGTWNGAEALAGNDGNMPGPEGGPVSDYLALDGGYGSGEYGGSGAWSATCVDCN